MGHEKGYDTYSRIEHNFGMPKPEGYRKAQRLMKLAEHFDIPVISFVDTPGAYSGLGAEQRGQSEAIARTTECCLSLGVPIVVVIIGVIVGRDVYPCPKLVNVILLIDVDLKSKKIVFLKSFIFIVIGLTILI